ncbi:hypothetical protein BT96DRAFT_1001435 [Gymnopus androsaceus JB14]|uniref:Uncharacterized protein n=1 Tax=Gymnopus androsaceus JB14 TaxID=1447944 RepID=A0A6A4H1T8_9AGAR|nr:hypothetical protein BT96DRAFT_1001435 [Gymnopus androsaceus JB14]
MDNLTESSQKSPLTAQATLVSVLEAYIPSSMGETNQREEEVLIAGNIEPTGVTHVSAAWLESLVPSQKHGLHIQKYPPLSIPKIPSTPLNASQYMCTTPQYPSTSLLPSAALPSPITPLFTDDSSFVNATASQACQTRSPFGDFSGDILLASLWSHPKCKTMSESQRIERAMEVLLNELHFSSIGEFFSLYIQQIPHDTESFSNHHCYALKAFLQGHTKVTPVEIVEKLYHHHYSYPSYKSAQKEEKSSLSFHPSFPPEDIKHA